MSTRVRNPRLDIQRVYELLPSEPPGLSVRALAHAARLHASRMTALSLRLYALRESGAVKSMRLPGSRALRWIKLWSAQEFSELLKHRATAAARKRALNRAATVVHGLRLNERNVRRRLRRGLVAGSDVPGTDRAVWPSMNRTARSCQQQALREARVLDALSSAPLTVRKAQAARVFEELKAICKAGDDGERQQPARRQWWLDDE